MEKINDILYKCKSFDLLESAAVVGEILKTHPAIAWNPTTKHLDGIESISINGNAIQFNLEEYEENQ